MMPLMTMSICSPGRGHDYGVIQKRRSRFIVHINTPIFSEYVYNLSGIDTAFGHANSDNFIHRLSSNEKCILRASYYC